MKKITHSLLAAAVAMTPMVMTTTNVAAKSVSITKYGAKSNDKKDDTKAIQEALDKNKNATITFPKGTFYAKVLYLRGNQTLKLSKGTVMKRLPFKKHPEDAWVIFHSKKKGYKGFKQVTITGGTWDGQVHKNNKTSEHKGFEVDHGAKVTIKNTTLKNVSGLHMIETNACKNVVIDHVKFMNQYFYSGKNHSSVDKFTPQTCEAFQFDSATKGAAEAYPLDGTVCQNVKITNCTFKNVQSGLGTHHNEKKYWKHMHKNITVANNTFTNMKGDAIHLNNVNGATVTKNKATNGVNFVTFYHSSNIKTANNVVKTFKTPYQVANNSNNITSESDQFTNTKDSASPAMSVFVDGNSSLTMNNATIASKKKGAVVVNNSALTLTNSRLTSNHAGSYGVIVNNGKTVNISNNSIAGHTGGWGIVAKGAQNLTVANNSVSSFKNALSLIGVANANVSGNTYSVDGDAMHVDSSTAQLTSNKAANGTNFMAISNSSNVTASSNSSDGYKTALQVTGNATANITNDSYTNPVDSASPAFNVFLDHGNATIANTMIEAKAKGNVVANNGSNLALTGDTLSNTKYQGSYGLVTNNAGNITIDSCNFAGNSGLYAMVLKGGNFTITNNTASSYNIFLVNKGNNSITDANNNVGAMRYTVTA